eukprot:GHRR01003719.1.p2 GENE.GHRR01003719.1~~GHRR01003719.1.p2  ORF type:complete len:181 (+),score=61.70 GHRR01003719.1:2136-2678(+)
MTNLQLQTLHTGMAFPVTEKQTALKAAAVQQLREQHGQLLAVLEDSRESAPAGTTRDIGNDHKFSSSLGKTRHALCHRRYCSHRQATGTAAAGLHYKAAPAGCRRFDACNKADPPICLQTCACSYRCSIIATTHLGQTWQGEVSCSWWLAKVAFVMVARCQVLLQRLPESTLEAANGDVQ